VTTPSTADVRTWAREQGMATADRGRLPRSVLEAYAAAHGEKPSGAPAKGRSRTSQKPKGKATTPAKARSARSSRGTTTARSADVRTVEAATPPPSTPAQRDNGVGKPTGQDVEQRLQQVEAQLADALARLTALESRTLRSLLGLRITL
jgi:hypothetical protein